MVIYNLKKKTPIIFEETDLNSIEIIRPDKILYEYSNLLEVKDYIDIHDKSQICGIKTNKYALFIGKGVFMVTERYGSTSIITICIVYKEEGINRVVVSEKYSDITVPLKTLVNRFVKHYGFKLSDIEKSVLTEIRTMFRPKISLSDFNKEAQSHLSSLFLNSVRTQSNVISV